MTQFPNRPAVWDNGVVLTHEEVWQQSLRICQCLHGDSIEVGSHIGLAISKSAELLVAILGVWMHGSVFVPLDPNLPMDRLIEYANQSNLALVLGGVNAEHFSCPVRFYACSEPVVTDQVATDQIAAAYLIFSSGSTGRPKGILVSHRHLVTVLKEQIHVLNLNNHDRVLWALSMQFDASISDFGVSLLSGACLFIDTQKEIIEALKTHEISYADLPPSLLAIYAPTDLPETLNRILVGGEVCPFPVLNIHRQVRDVLVVYGPTEGTICTSMILCTRHSGALPQSIGHPISGVNYQIVDGELWLGGDCLAIGYWNNPMLNEKKWVQVAEKRFFRTGDSVRYHNGEYQYLGRVDRQFKWKGHLIAPEEIEFQCHQLPEIERAAAVLREPFLMLYLQPRAPHLEAHLQTHLSKSLPDWMLPSQVVWLDHFPETTSGKVDYQALVTHRAPCVAVPETIQRNLWTILFEEILGHPVGPDDSFYDKGGDSLMALSLLAIAEARGMGIHISEFKANPTPRLLMRALKNRHTCLDTDLEVLVVEQLSRYPVSHRSLTTSSRIAYLTGATGQLGLAVLVRLCQKQYRVRVLMRDANRELALKRLPQECHPHIEVYLGDLSKSSDIDAFTREANGTPFFHCAAQTEFDKCKEELFDINVSATAQILNRVGSSVNMAASLVSFVSSDRDNCRLYENDALSPSGYRIHGGYAQSKWMAERLAESHGATVFRFGLLTSGQYSKDTDWFRVFLLGLVDLREVPEGRLNYRFNLTSLDLAADAFVSIGLDPLRDGHYHVASQYGVSLLDLIEAFENHGVRIDICKDIDFFKRFHRDKNLSTASRLVFLALQNPNHPRTASPEYSIFLQSGFVFDNSRVRTHGFVFESPLEALVEEVCQSTRRNTN